MELVLNVFMVASFLVCLGVVSFVVVSFSRKASALKAVSVNREKKAEENAMRMVREFVPAGANDNSGRLFAELVEVGYFTSFRMGNHGEKFDYNRQLEDSLKYLTPGISAALKKVGENYERHRF